MKITVLIIFLSLLCFENSKAEENSKQMKVNYESLVSRADLDYNVPVFRSEEGMPVGNGRMGSLVWTTPSAMHFQINRIDVFAMGCNTNSFPDGHTDYSNGCGYVDINMVDYGDDVFTGNAFNQHLSVYDGLTTVKGNGIASRVLAWSDKDVIATEIDDQRNNPSVVNIDLRMLRYAINYIGGKNWDLTSHHAIQIQSGSFLNPNRHTATSRLDIRDGRIILIQEFREGDYYSASAVAIGISGRESKASYYNEATVRLSIAPGKGKFTILTSSASSYNPEEDVADLALKQMDAAQSKSFDDLLESNRDWWGNYWSEAFVRLHSADGVADEVEKNFTYYLYIMASCSRGEIMTGYRNMLWNTTGDMSMWGGAKFWWNNEGAYYNGLTPVNRPELIVPMFKTFTNHYDSYATAAKQQWGSKGIWIPETTWWNGLDVLPDSIASEMRDLYLVRKPWEERSKSFMDYAETKNDLNSRWNWLHLRRNSRPGEKGGPFAWTTHIMSATAKIAYVYWLNYAYYLDKEWLGTTGYPMIKGVTEFYCNFPNLFKEADGKYHLHYVNNLESDWGGKDTPEELLAMNAMLPIAIRASEILGVDADRRLVWKEILDNLTPIPVSVLPAEYYDFCSIGSANKELFKSVHDAYNKMYSEGVDENTEVTHLSRNAVAAASLGLADHVEYMIPSQIRSYKNDTWEYKGRGASGVGVLRNRLTTREGPGAIGCQRLGLVSQALCTALLQSILPTPGGEPVNYIFPAWPKEWDAQFTLAARDAFKISSSMEKGQIEFVEIYSQKGGQCRVQNPWPGTAITLYRNGKISKNITGSLLVFSTKSGETLTIVPKGEKLGIKEIL